MKKEKQERKVIHVYIIDQDKNYYFGSMKAIYNVLTVDQVGLQYQSLINYYSANDTEEFRNNKCIIRKGVLITQPKQRIE